MNSSFWLLGQHLPNKRLAACTAFFLLAIAPVSLAEYTDPGTLAPTPSPHRQIDMGGTRYSDPGTLTPSRNPRRSIGGTRGGCGTGDLLIKTLAPQKYMGQTASTHPTLAWQVTDSQPHPVEFRLYKYDANGQLQRLIQEVIPQSSSGIMTWTLPENEPGLSVGEYYWQVALICDPNRPSEDVIDATDLEVVPPPTGLAAQLATSGDLLEQVNLLAAAGLWYDALGKAALSADPRAREIERSLLEQLEQRNSKS